MRGPSQSSPPLVIDPSLMPQYPQLPFDPPPPDWSVVDHPQAIVTLGGRPLTASGYPPETNHFHPPHDMRPYGPMNPHPPAQYDHHPITDQRPLATNRQARRPSAPPSVSSGSQAQPPSPRQSTFNGSNGKNKAPNNSSSNSPPAVLIREKKQKACANCRRAKLKCIVDDGETECVRCKARKEKCVFYPRSHDEDWQQTLTTDVYNAAQHLSHLTGVVRHLIHHITAAGYIPPFPGPPVDNYQVPDRDMGVLQGWAAERNRDAGEKRKRAENGDRYPQRRPSGPEYTHQNLPSTDRIPPQWSPDRHVMPLPPQPSYEPFPSRPPMLPDSSSHRYSLPELPSPLRNQVSNHVQLTPTSDQDINPSHVPLPEPFPSGSSIPPPHGSAEEVVMPPPPLPPRSDILSSPVEPNRITPTSLQEISSVTSQDRDTWIVARTSPNGMHDDISGTATINADQSSSEYPMEEAYGCEDGRQTVISRGIIPPKDAEELVTYFHNFLAPHLYGCHLQLREFPYLPSGPKAITPFILAVECLLASERVHRLYKYHFNLADAVLNVLLRSPAESFETIESSRETQRMDEQVLGQAFHDDQWDPELGIGPEEIVAACALASFIAQREQSKHIADYAFLWARGWVNYLTDGDPDNQFRAVEVMNIVPPLRRPTAQQMARVWLLSFIVAGQEAVQNHSIEPAVPYDPSRYCRLLLPPDSRPSAAKDLDPHDVMLVFHARLISLFSNWARERWRIEANSLASRSSNSMAHKRLASTMNADLNWLREDLKSYGLDPEWTKQFHLDWLHAKMVVNSIASKRLFGGPDDLSLSTASRTLAVDSALQLLQAAAAWEPPEALLDLPLPYPMMISLAGCEVSEILIEVAQGTFDRAACPTSIPEAAPLLSQVGAMFRNGGLREEHVIRHMAIDMENRAFKLGRIEASQRAVTVSPTIERAW